MAARKNGMAAKSGLKKGTVARRVLKAIQASALEEVKAAEATGEGAGESQKASVDVTAEVRALREEVREAAMECARQIVYDELPKMIRGIVREAKKGNHNAARFLFQFVGMKGFQPVAKAEVKKEEPKPAVVAVKSPKEAVLSFYEKLGMTPPALLPLSAGLRKEPATEPWMEKPSGEEAVSSCELQVSS